MNYISANVWTSGKSPWKIHLVNLLRRQIWDEVEFFGPIPDK